MASLLASDFASSDVAKTLWMVAPAGGNVFHGRQFVFPALPTEAQIGGERIVPPKRFISLLLLSLDDQLLQEDFSH